MGVFRSFWRKATWFSCFLLAVGLVEYFVLVQLHSSLLHADHKAEDERLMAGKSVTSRRETEDGKWAVMPWGIHDSQQQHLEDRERREAGRIGEIRDNSDDLNEIRSARELHDMRIERLNNFKQPRRGLQLQAEQEERSHKMKDNMLNDTNLRQLLQVLNLTHILDGGGFPHSENINENFLKNFLNESVGNNRLSLTLDNILYTEQKNKQWKQDRTQDTDKEEDSDEHYDEDDDYEDNHRYFDPDDFIVSIDSNGRVNVTRKQLEPEVLVENTTFPVRDMTKFEKEGSNIMLTIRTTLSNHRKRLPLLFETWLTKVNTSQVFLVSDGEDPFTELWTTVKGIHYVDAKCGNSYSREQLCCKAGVELGLMYEEQNILYDWICHVDDDMYVNMLNLVELLAGFDPRKDPIYFGRSGSLWHKPRRVKRTSKLSQPGKKYHFAVGGMYCLSRAMLNKTKKWIVGGEAFSKSCSLTKEPEDVTVGLIVALQNYTLSRTERINTHGLHLATVVDPYSLPYQVAISYGYGATQWGDDPYNAVYVPDGLFSIEEDESQFRSLHCLLYPHTSWCLRQSELVLELRRQQEQMNSDTYPDIDTTH